MTAVYRSLGLSVIYYLVFLAQTGNGRLGDPCMGTAECNHWNLQCVSFQCVCWPPYVPSVDNSECAVDIDGRCQRTTDVCYDTNAVCSDPPSIWDSSWCKCRDGFIQDPETRLCQPRLGASCEIGGLACISGSCIDGTCQCGDGLVASQNEDECGVDIGGACTTANPNCADPFAECRDSTNTCQCQDGYQAVVEDGATICKVALGSSCVTNSECGVPNSACEIMRSGNGACTCSQGYVPSGTRTSCLSVTNHWPGTCEETQQCSAMFGRYSVCQTNACVCSSGYVYVPEDFGCVPIHTAVEPRASESVKLLAATLLPYLPMEAQLAVEEIMDQL